VGRSGAGKSELAELAQQHFGAGLDARHQPANWSSTANATEVLAFAAADALLDFDDYSPAGGAADVKLQAAADRIIRGQGNHAGRSRMTAGAEVRAGKPPRGMALITGEDLPDGSSLRARLWTVEVAADSVSFGPFGRLTECQREAASGLYAEAWPGSCAGSPPSCRRGVPNSAPRWRSGGPGCPPAGTRGFRPRRPT
jgi:hypothetical protein